MALQLTWCVMASSASACGDPSPSQATVPPKDRMTSRSCSRGTSRLHNNTPKVSPTQLAAQNKTVTPLCTDTTVFCALGSLSVHIMQSSRQAVGRTRGRRPSRETARSTQPHRRLRRRRPRRRQLSYRTRSRPAADHCPPGEGQRRQLAERQPHLCCLRLRPRPAHVAQVASSPCGCENGRRAVS